MLFAGLHQLLMPYHLHQFQLAFQNVVHLQHQNCRIGTLEASFVALSISFSKLIRYFFNYNHTVGNIFNFFKLSHYLTLIASFISLTSSFPARASKWTEVIYVLLGLKVMTTVTSCCKCTAAINEKTSKQKTTNFGIFTQFLSF